jgi:hypothetical protein
LSIEEIENLINELQSAKDVVEVREKIEREWNAATTSHQRDALFVLSVELVKVATDRDIAVENAAAPDFSQAELLAKHTELQPDSAPAPKAPPSNASVSYAFGATLGKKLKGLLRR